MKREAERRSRKRIPASVPTRIRTAHGVEHAAQTRDVSSNGVFLYTKSRMEAGAEVELVLILPPELTSGEKCWVCCQATLVRVEEQGSEFGVAAQIRRMDLLPELTAEGRRSNPPVSAPRLRSSSPKRSGRTRE